MAAITYKTTDELEVDPISRIEGHLGAKVETDASGIIEDASIHGNLWRGFENFLLGRNTNDAITFTQRICGVCPLPHATASMFACDGALGVSRGYITFKTNDDPGYGVPTKAVHIRNLVYATEFVMSHITHFYHLAAPSYVQGPPIPPWTPYYRDEQYHGLLRNAGAAGAARPVPEQEQIDTSASGTFFGHPLKGALDGYFGGLDLPSNLYSYVIKSYVKALRIRRLTFEAGALFAGRMPMTSSFVAGGVTNRFASQADYDDRCDAFRTMYEEIGDFVVKDYVPTVFALSFLYPEFDNVDNSLVAAVVDEPVAIDGAGAGTLRNASAAMLGANDDPSGTIPWAWTYTDGVDFTASGADITGFAAAAGTTVYFSYAYAATGQGYGGGCQNLLSWGCFPNAADGTLHINGRYSVNDTMEAAFMTGVADIDDANTFIETNLYEFIARSKYNQYSPTGLSGDNEWDDDWKAQPALVTRTVPDRSGTSTIDGYSWLKAPRILHTDDEFYPMEVGPFARMVLNGKYLTDGATALLDVAAYNNIYRRGAGLKLESVSKDLAFALVKEGLVDVQVNGSDIDVVDAGGYTGLGTTGIVAYLAGLVGGYSVLDRLRGRAVECYWLCHWMIGGFDPATGWSSTGWIDSLKTEGAAGRFNKGLYRDVATPTGVQTSYGVSEAPRGALAHHCTSDNQIIKQYQCIVPTTWNCSPKDGAEAGVAVGGDAAANNAAATKRGPAEQALIGVPFEDAPVTVGAIVADSGIEVMRVVQSFDPCIACAVH